jgi:isocitrate dehydrogenase
MAEKITMGSDGKLNVPITRSYLLLKGDGIGPDIWKASVRVFDAAVKKAFKGEKKNRMERSSGWPKSF